MTLRANAPRKYSKSDKKEMLAHYKSQLAYLKRRRVKGAVGYLEFIEYDY